MNFSIEFTHPWLLLLIIPTMAIVLYTFFKVNKRFRYSANRIVSIVLCSIIVLLSVFMVSGISFKYDEKNKDNEVILLVDYSDSNGANNEAKDIFVQETIESTPKNVKLGIVKFGYDQVCALGLTNKLDGAYEKYINSENPNNSATNIERALEYGLNMITNKATSKMVVLTDGIETDGEAIKAVSDLALNGVKLDVVEFNNEQCGNEVQINTVTMPKKAIVVDDVTQLEVNVKSSISSDIQLKMFDNGVEVESKFVNLSRGDNNITVNHIFKNKGLHEIVFTAESLDDTKLNNNKIHSFVNIDNVDAILILERENEGEKLQSLLQDNYKITKKSIKDAPMDITELRDYDQVILMNIANKDMPAGFDIILNQYVKEYGGGLLTVGGMKTENGQTTANTYNREDMKDTLYQEMIPVIAEDYKPPVAVTLVIDISGSMFTPVGEDSTMMEEAKKSAKAALRSLESKDYMGVVVFGNSGTEIIEPTPVSQREKINSAITNICAKMESTFYSKGIEKAAIGLKSIDGVNKKHIILISDGAPSASDGEYLSLTENNYNNGITTSVISYGNKVLELEKIAEIGHGNNYVADVSNESLTEALSKDLKSPEIREYEYKTFKPTIGDITEVLKGVNEGDIPTLNGFFGTKLKYKAVAPLVGEYGEPIYAEWDYGKGKVGSFMCDLSEDWSMEFINNPVGEKIINNIVNILFPVEKINKDRIEISLNNKNYELKANIYTKLNVGEKLTYSVRKVGTNELVKEDEIKDAENNAIIELDLLEEGIYEICVNKLNKKGEVLESNTKYQEISYSKEYDAFENSINHHKYLMELANEGNGKVVLNANEIFEDLVMIYHKEFDPRYVLASLVIVLLLSDLAVRKFKFKDKKKKQK